ncbi:MAG: His/Gly/Thr/Pro-type tRNA ligase C-terminal domain-containing protein [Patescibacteria group bacterium]|nr:His/Gly/Thr/Pro-type tRNA ligase C-terminal domain-containing protein [Patescibacteria group bacterium]
MKLSQLFSRTKKQISKDETSINAQLLIKAGFVNKEMAGVYSYLPLGFRVLKKVEQVIRDEIEAIGGQEILMPTLTSIENYKITKRNNLDVLFKTNLYNGSEFVLNQSHEEVIVPLVKQFVNSYRDLPLSIYQIQNKFRNEVRAKSGLLRGREFIMKDLYSFHADEEDLDKYYKKATKAYFKIFKRLGLDPILTFASGGTFSKYSHEFQVLTESGEDEIYVCDKCKVAINKEIINEHTFCPECRNVNLTKKKSIEVGNIFKLKDKYSKPFNLIFKNKNSKDQIVTMGCYGIGLSRAMGAVVEIHNDAKGIIWPTNISPYLCHIVEIGGKDRNLNFQAEAIYKNLLDAGIEVAYDDRDVSIGEKFSDADLIGCPWQIIISPKTLNVESVEIKDRRSGKSQLLKIKNLIKHLK